MNFWGVFFWTGLRKILFFSIFYLEFLYKNAYAFSFKFEFSSLSFFREPTEKYNTKTIQTAQWMLHECHTSLWIYLHTSYTKLLRYFVK